MANTKKSNLEKINDACKKFNKVELLPGNVYINNITKLRVRCLKCGYEFDKSPKDISKGSGCPQCAHKEKVELAAKIHKEQKLAKIQKFLKDNNFELLSKDELDWDNTLKVKHIPCGKIIEKTFSALYRSKCTDCTERKRVGKKSNFLDRIKENPNIKLLSEFKEYRKLIKIKFLDCGHVSNVLPSNLLKHLECPICNKENSIKKFKEYIKNRDTNYYTKEAFYETYKDRIDFSEFELISEYAGSDSPVRLKHKCGKIIEIVPHSIRKRKLQCKYCDPTYKKSIGEKLIKEFLKRENINYITQYKHDDCRLINKLSIDFFLSDLNIAIEYDGEFHFFEALKNSFNAVEKFDIRLKRDNAKNEFFIRNNIKFYRIPYWKKQDLESILLQIKDGKEIDDLNIIPKEIKVDGYSSYYKKEEE